MEDSVLSELFKCYSDDVFRLAYSYLGNRTDAEDVCQAVFLKLAERRARLKEGKEKAWLLTCTANACKNHLRSFWRRNVEELNETIPFQDSRNRNVHQAVMTFRPNIVLSSIFTTLKAMIKGRLEDFYIFPARQYKNE